MTESILWRRLDTAGHDACRLEKHGVGWQLDGASVFRHEDSFACLRYTVDCDDAWRTSEGRVRGWLGPHAIDFHIARSPVGIWTFNGGAVAGLRECVDLDLGFTPATNLTQLRRVALPIGHAAHVPVAWLDVSNGTLSKLEQRYERRSDEEYSYEAPRFEYYATLRVSTTGFVTHYPGLWEAEI